MKGKKSAVVASLICVLISPLGTPRQVQAQGDKSSYPKMGPLEQYLMDRDAEIALARSAAPESISSDATVVVLGRQGYETAVQGKNGFVCAVERAGMNLFDNPEFWNRDRLTEGCAIASTISFAKPFIFKIKIEKEGLPRDSPAGLGTAGP